MCSRFYAVLPLLLLAGCSVLEDRAQCPCHLVLEFSDEANYCADSISVALQSGAYSSFFVVCSEDYGVPVKVDVPSRTELNVSALDASSSDSGNDGCLTISEGEQCPQAYMFTSRCDISAEDAFVYVKLHKNYCGISVSFSSPAPDLYDMVVSGNVCGYSSDGIPLPGRFIYSPSFDENSMSFFCIPRQIDGSLKLGIRYGEGPVRYFALGNYILESGYDWNKEDLDDIVVCIDYAATEIRITVDDWSIEEEYDVVI